MVKEDARTILVVDDDPSVHKALNEVLSLDNRFTLHFASGGYEAFKNLDSIKPDLIILDLLMPVGSGAEFLEKARAFYEGNLPHVIVLTNLQSNRAIADTVEGNILDFVVKGDTTLATIVDMVYDRLDVHKPVYGQGGAEAESPQ